MSKFDEKLRGILNHMYVERTPYIDKDIDQAISEIRKLVLSMLPVERTEEEFDAYMKSHRAVDSIEYGGIIQGYNQAIREMREKIGG